ncbi:hypothetical protein LCGC14_1676570 [marine sediment metagenome]|uniref:DUF2283 domain-containing protein n=1 Tax=marine sediment metagenome TaxID=412755 RepID=A0A0F9K5G9_9ZZZZ
MTLIHTLYDESSDVLYIALGQPKSAYGSEQPNGLLFRYSYERDDPCGVTVFRFAEAWHENIEGLSAEIATFLGASMSEVKEAIQAVALTS